MAGLLDVCSLLLTSAFFLGAILGTALITRKCRALIDATKASLEERGWMVFPQHEGGNGECSGDHDGSTIVLVQTRKRRMDPERYLDATQRGVMKALQASTFGAPQSQSQTTRARASISSSSLLDPAGAHSVHSRSRERDPVAGGGGGGDSGSGMMDESSTLSSSERIKQWTRKDLLIAADEIASSSSEKIRRLRDTLSSRWY